MNEVVLAAALRLADEIGDEERRGASSIAWRVEFRSDESREAERLIREHGLPLDSIPAYRRLAQSRGVPLEDVLRAWMRGDLRDIVTLPAASQGQPKSRVDQRLREQVATLWRALASGGAYDAARARRGDD